jgi:hypothetical protein
MSKPFHVADLSPQGELRQQTRYTYDQLAQLPGAADLIVSFSAILYREPEGFELPLGEPAGGLSLRFRASADSAGIATVRAQSQLVSLSFLAAGLQPHADRITLQAFQHHLVQATRDTPFEPAFALLDLPDRPLLATIAFSSPPDDAIRYLAAIADRCFAAAYFRRLFLA